VLFIREVIWLISQGWDIWCINYSKWCEECFNQGQSCWCASIGFPWCRDFRNWWQIRLDS